MSNFPDNTARQNISNHKRLIRLRDVMDITGLSRPYIYKLSSTGQFPKKVRLTERSIAWVEAEVFAWIDDRINKRDKGMIKWKNA